MKDYNFTLDRLEVRSSTEGKRKRYVVKGYASVPNMKDMYQFSKDRNGKYKSFKSVFTDHAVASMEKQMKAKKVFIDIEHEIATNMNVKNILDGMKADAIKSGIDLGSSPDKIMDYIKSSAVAFAKPTDFRIDDKGLYVQIDTNPYYEDIDPRYYNFAINSLMDGFINGMSINFVPTKVTDQIIDGERVDMIDDVDLFGISLVSQPALPDNNIFEVAMRSAMEFKSSQMEERTMTEVKVDNSEVEKLKQELAEMKAKTEAKEQAEKQSAIDR